jgi:hypothetical protein
MDRNKSSDLGDRQAEGNLGNERVRNISSDDSASRRNRNHDSSSREERWSPGSDSMESDEEFERTDGSER